MDHQLSIQFQSLLQRLEQKFGGDGEMDLNAVLFLIGVQEVGKGYQRYTKDEKMNLMHVAICTILEPYGYYQFKETDPDGWPHFERTQKLPSLELREQEALLMEAAINYFVENKLIAM